MKRRPFPVDQQVMFPKNRLVRVGRRVAVWSAIGGFLWVSGDTQGAMVEVNVACLFFAGGLLLIAAGRVSEIGKLGVISERSLNLMKVGIVVFFAGLLQTVLVAVLEPRGKIPLAWYRFSQALLFEILLCFAIGSALIGLGCALHSANVRTRFGGVVSCLVVLAGTVKIAYELRFPSDDDPFAVFFDFFLSGLGCSVGLLIAYFGLKREGRLRLQQIEAAHKS
jgi:hypothetical protein